MLHFFRKYQRFFFLFTTIIIILSFSFFGTFSTLVSTNEVQDQKIGKAVDGSFLSKKEIEALSHFLATSNTDRGLLQRNLLPNLFNDGVVQKDFLSTGMGPLLAKSYFDELKDDVASRLMKAKHFRPYVHPQAPFLNAEAIWAHFAPTLSEHFKTLVTTSEEPRFEGFQLLCDLYLAQASFPGDILKQFLIYHQSQYGWLKADPLLQESSLSLFGFESSEEWFGQRFLNLVSQFILNAAIIAEQKGYKISKEEVRADLLHNLQNSLEQFAAGSHGTQEDLEAKAESAFHPQLRSMGLDEATALKIWGKVMLFRRLFNDVGASVFLDSLSYRELGSFANQGAEVELYQLPEELRLKDFYSLLQLQLYLEAVASNASKIKQGHLLLPTAFLSPDEVEKKYPELVQSRFTIEYAEVKKEPLMQKIGLRQMWDWQLQEEHWQELKATFTELVRKESTSREERFALLESLDPKTRFKVDQFSRTKILEQHPEWIEEEFAKAPLQTVTLGIRSKGGQVPFRGLQEVEPLLELLQKAPLKGEENTSRSAFEAQRQLDEFSPDDQTIYKIVVIKRAQGKQILSFGEAAADKTLAKLVDKRLEEAYPDVRKKDTAFFQNEDGSWKAFVEVKEQIGALLYVDLLKKIEESSIETASLKNSEHIKRPLEFYATHRLYAHVKAAKEQLKKNPQDTLWVKTEMRTTSDPFEPSSPATQWQLIKREQEVKRNSHVYFDKAELFSLPEGSFSSLFAPLNGDLCFFHLLKKIEGAKKLDNQVLQGQEMLAIDAKKCLMHHLLQQIKERGGIYSMSQTEE